MFLAPGIDEVAADIAGWIATGKRVIAPWIAFELRCCGAANEDGFFSKWLMESWQVFDMESSLCWDVRPFGNGRLPYWGVPQYLIVLIWRNLHSCYLLSAYFWVPSLPDSLSFAHQRLFFFSFPPLLSVFFNGLLSRHLSNFWLETLYWMTTIPKWEREEKNINNWAPLSEVQVRLRISRASSSNRSFSPTPWSNLELKSTQILLLRSSWIMRII